MPKLFRPYYRDQATGERRQLKKYYAKVRDADGVVRKVPLSANKAAAEAMVRRLLDAVERKRAGLGDPFEGHKLRPLCEHLADWEAALRVTGVSDKHLRETVRLVRRVVVEGGLIRLEDLRAGPVQAYLRGLQADGPPRDLDPAKLEYTRVELASLLGVKPSAVPPLVRSHRLEASGNGRARRYPKSTAAALLGGRGQGMSVRSVNMHLAATKQFAGWLVKGHRLAENPFADVSFGDPERDRRLEFAVLDLDEIRLLIATAHASPEAVRGLTGRDRAMLYLAAVTTALRPVELSRLRRGDFLLTGAAPRVSLDGGRTKNGKDCEQALPAAVAEELEAYLGDRQPGDTVWAGSWFERAGEVIRRDIARAGLPFTKPGPSGRETTVSFYSLRHSAGLLAEKGGASLREVMTLMRHGDPRLTMRTYGRLNLQQLTEAAAKFPTLLPDATTGMSPGVPPHGQKCVPAGDDERELLGAIEEHRRQAEVGEVSGNVADEGDRGRTKAIDKSSPGWIRTNDQPINSHRAGCAIRRRIRRLPTFHALHRPATSRHSPWFPEVVWR